MNMNNKSIQVVLMGLATVSLFLVTNGVGSYAQTTYSNQTASSNTTSSAANATGNNSTSLPSNNPVAKNIDEGIKAIKADDKSAGKKALLHAESALEGKSDAVDAEKHVEAAIQALKEGDTNGAISHAEQAKEKLP
jgi:hypothetical protein